MGKINRGRKRRTTSHPEENENGSKIDSSSDEGDKDDEIEENLSSISSLESKVNHNGEDSSSSLGDPSDHLVGNNNNNNNKTKNKKSKNHNHNHNHNLSRISNLTNSQASVTEMRAEGALLRRMRLAAQELDSVDGDFVGAANVVKSCAEALYAIRK